MEAILLSYQELLNRIEDAKLADKKTIAIVPVGCVEQHGPYLPLETDAIIATEGAKELCRKLVEGNYWGYAFPTVYYSPSRSNSNYCGTVSIDEGVFRSYIKAICASLLDSPFDGLSLLCAHGPAKPSLVEIAFTMVNEQFRNQHQVKPILVTPFYESPFPLETVFNQKPGRHADWREFLLMYLLLGEKYFDNNKIAALKTFHENNKFDIMASGVYGIPLEFRSTQGVIGSPLPDLNANWLELSTKLWDIFLANAVNKLTTDLDAFGEAFSENRK